MARKPPPRGPRKWVPTTPEKEAAREAAREKKKEKDRVRLEQLHRDKAIERMARARDRALLDGEEEPTKDIKVIFGGKVAYDAAMGVVALSKHANNEELRFACQRYILDRVHGPIPKDVSVGGRDGHPIVIQDQRMSLEQLLGPHVAALGIPGLGSTIEAEITEEVVKNADDSSEVS